MSDTSLQNFKLADWLPAGVSPDDVIAILAALAVLATFLATWQALRGDDSLDRRLQPSTSPTDQLRATALPRPSYPPSAAPAALAAARARASAPFGIRR